MLASKLDDVEELKSVIEAKEAEIQKLRKENKELKKQIKGGEDNAVERTPEDLQKQAEMLMKAIRKNIEGQMVYKNGMKHSGKRAAADFPGVDLEVVKAMLGAEICSKASNGSKQFTVKVDNGALSDMQGIGYGGFTKSLRYGGQLQLEEGLKFVYNKGESQLRITGMFKMF
ncbi:g6261 [Coccomyxa viridis]|uniref:G6261 protein n=1 Tax=Coccomyxa viridis TaxID=1274662 RepID=A0ABP1G1J5_9CHLO